MKKTAYHRMAFNNVFGFIAFVSLIISLYPGCSNQTSIEKLLKETANNLNKSCPMIVDSETQLDNVVVMPGNVFQYNYTLVNMQRETIDIEGMRNYIKPILINNIKTSPELKIYRDNKVTLAYYYKDRDGVYLTKIEITPDKYEN